MGVWGTYPGKILFVDETGVSIGECYGPMSTESGGPVCSLEALIADENNTHHWVRENFGEKLLAEALVAAHEYLAKKSR